MQMNTLAPLECSFPCRCTIRDGAAVQNNVREKPCSSASCTITNTRNVLKQIPSACVSTTFAAAVVIPHNPQRT